MATAASLAIVLHGGKRDMIPLFKTFLAVNKNLQFEILFTEINKEMIMLWYQIVILQNNACISVLLFQYPIGCSKQGLSKKKKGGNVSIWV